MFIRFFQGFDAYYTRKAVISRLRELYKTIHYEEHVQHGHKLQKGADGSYRVVPNEDNLVINLSKNNVAISITVTPSWITKNGIMILIPKELCTALVRQENGKLLWLTEMGKRILATDDENDEHITLKLNPPFTHQKEELMQYILAEAFAQADVESESDEDDFEILPGEFRHGQEVVRID